MNRTVAELVLSVIYFGASSFSIGHELSAEFDQAETIPLRCSKDLSSEDWSSIRAVHQEWENSFKLQENGLVEAYNSAQAMTIQFDDRGFDAKPDDLMWKWGLELVSWGYLGFQETPSQLGQGSIEKKDKVEKLVFCRSANLEEWYINGTSGLEHGWTIHHRPTYETGELFDSQSQSRSVDRRLILKFAIRGALVAEVFDEGRSVRFLDGAGEAEVVYGGLKSWDALGRMLPAQIVGSGGGIEIRVDDREAQYPVTIDPIAQQAYLKASNTEAGDEFGRSIAIDGNTVVVGAPGEDSTEGGINPPHDHGPSRTGAIYVFVREEGVWRQQAFIKAHNPTFNDEFGSAVAIDGDTIVVGSWGEDSITTGINPPFSDGNSNKNHGAIYVFVRDGTRWTQEAFIKASNADKSDQFGYSVAISGNTIVAGAIHEDSNAKGVNGDSSDNSAPSSGAAYVYVRSNGEWSEQAYIKASNTGSLAFGETGGDRFGYAVAISGNFLVVGAPEEDSSAQGVNGDQLSNHASRSGAAYVYQRIGSSWFQSAYLKASNTEGGDGIANSGDFFGAAVAIAGNTIVVGAPCEDSAAKGVDNDQVSNEASDAGACYVYVWNGISWQQQSYLKASNTDSEDQFGRAVSIDGDRLIVGALFEQSLARGVNGNQTVNNSAVGAAYCFERSGGDWIQVTYLKPSNSGVSLWFGSSVGISGELIVAGASKESSDARGVDGYGEIHSATDSGAAYLFDFDALPTAELHLESASGAELFTANGIWGGSSLAFGDVGLGRKSRRALTVRNLGAKALTDLSIAAFGGQSGSFLIENAPPLILNPGESATFDVVFAPTLFTGYHSSTLRVLSSDSDENPFDIKLSGSGRTVPDIVIEQPAGSPLQKGVTIDFGTVAVGGGSTLVFLLKNVGSANLSGIELSVLGDGADQFSVLEIPTQTIGIDEEVSFSVVFQPGFAAALNALLRIESNDSDENPFDISLIGQSLSEDGDADGDGLNDAAELGLAALGFDWQVSQSELVSVLFAHSGKAGLFTRSQVQGMSVGTVVKEVDRETGSATITLAIKKSDDLQDFVPFPLTVGQTTVNDEGELELEISFPQKEGFLLLEAK